MKITSIEPGRKKISGRVVKKVFAALALMLVMIHCVLIYGVMISHNVSYSASLPRIILDKTEEVYVGKILDMFDAGARIFKDSEHMEIAGNNLDTIETVFMPFWNSMPGDTLEAVLCSSRTLISKRYDLNSIQKIAAVFNRYGEIQIKLKESKKAVNTINSILSIAMASNLGFEGEKPLISYIWKYSYMKMASLLVKNLIDSGIVVEKSDLKMLIDKFYLYEKKSTGFYTALKNESGFSKRLFYSEIYGRSGSNFAVAWRMMSISLGELYYGNIIEQYDKIMNEALGVEGKEYAAAYKKLDELSNTHREIKSNITLLHAILFSKLNPVVTWLLSPMGKCFKSYNVSRCIINSAIIRLALAYEKDPAVKRPFNSRDIEKNAMLKNMPDALRDPFTGKSLLFKDSGSGEVIIYSAGYNMKDDGGKFEDGLDIKL